MGRVSMSDLKIYRTAVFDNSRWENFESRTGDVFICTPPKCGTTWTQTIVANLIRPEGDFPAPIMQLSPWIEAVFVPVEDMLSSLNAQTHRRVMKSHTAADGIPWFADAKYIFVGRDGRDAFMSMCNHRERMKKHNVAMLNAQAAAAGIPQMPAYDGDPHTFLTIWLENEDHFFNIVATYWARRSQENLLLVHFHDLKNDLPGETRRIADFLNIEVSEQQFTAVLERSSFEYMRSHPEMVGDFDIMFEGGIKGFIFKGTNGRWREVFSEDELIRYQQRAAELLPQEAIDWLENGVETA